MFPRLFQDANLAVMMGRLSDNLFVLDCDSRAAFEFVRDGLAERGIRAWVRSSTRGGQFWLRCADGEIENAKPRPDLDVIGTHKYSVAPPSTSPIRRCAVMAGARGRPAAAGLARHAGFPAPETGVAERERKPAQHGLSRPCSARHYRLRFQQRGELAAAMALLRQGMTDDAVCAEFARHRPPHYAEQRRNQKRGSGSIACQKRMSSSRREQPQNASTRLQPARSIGGGLPVGQQHCVERPHRRNRQSRIPRPLPPRPAGRRYAVPRLHARGLGTGKRQQGNRGATRLTDLKTRA